MKKSIAGKMTFRVSIVLVAAFMLLLAGTFFSTDRAVRDKGNHYMKALVGVYSDLLYYESDNLGRPVDLDFNDRVSFFGEYMCSWYRIDYAYAYVPDIEKGTITYISVTRNRKKYGDLFEDHMVGDTEPHSFGTEEMDVWEGKSVYAVQKNGRFGKATDVLLLLTDRFGNKVMVGAAMSTDGVRAEVLRVFLVVAIFMFIIVALLAGFLYLLIRHMVSNPARSISRKMSEYISEGKRSSIRIESDSDDEFSLIAGAFNKMTGDIDNYINDLNRLGREQERQQAEVDIAAGIQTGILPSNFAYLKNCAIKAVMKPAKLIGGDLYDYLEIDATHTMMVVADVSGKGIPSAIVMAIVLTSIRQFAKMGCSPADILGRVNAAFAEENPSLMFVTAFVGILDSETGILTYANAGHNPPYLIQDGLLVLDGAAGTPLGLFAEEEYADVTVPVREGDSVFLYTDGVNEAVNSEGEFYGTDRLEAVLRNTASLEKKHFVEAVEASLQEFTGDAEQNDDITMLSLFIRKRKPLELNYDVRDFSVIRECLLASSLPKPLVMDLCVAAEECFVNICSYAFDAPVPDGEKILFDLEYSNRVVMRFSDGGRRFDPREGLPDTGQYDVDTAVGGLGRLIAFTIADSVDYEYRDGRNILTITKSIK